MIYQGIIGISTYADLILQRVMANTLLILSAIEKNIELIMHSYLSCGFLKTFLVP